MNTDLAQIPSSRSDYRQAMLERTTPYPKGWFLICFSKDIPKSTIINRTFMGEEVVVFRTQSGKVAVLDAYCTHMGAHFGYGGTVVGENIKCPFHGYCFNTNGKCIKTAKNEPEPKEKSNNWVANEFDGLVMVYHDEANGHTPNWDIPRLDQANWSDMEYEEFVLNSHPQEIAENGIDIEHLSEIYGFKDVESLTPLNTGELSVTAKYRMSSPTGLLGRLDKSVKIDFEATQWGLGYSMVSAKIEDYGLQNRLFVFATPIEADKIYVRIAMSVKKIDKSSKNNAALTLLPKKMLQRLVLNSSLQVHTRDVEQDYKSWDNKIHLDAHSSDSILQFRAWARQFQ